MLIPPSPFRCLYPSPAILGILDNLSLAQLRLAAAGAAALAATVVVAYVAHVRLAADDDPIGEATVPLSLVMDQREHTLLLRLSLPPTADGGGADGGGGAAARGRAARDGRGMIKVVLSASER